MSLFVMPTQAGMTELDCPAVLPMQLNIDLFASYKNESMNVVKCFCVRRS
jgi:hypothetical protein